jgi:hypothetical protein
VDSEYQHWRWYPNVIVAATMRDSVYLFDADASPCVTYWHKPLLPTGETYGSFTDVGSSDIYPDIGILGTPVIDASGTIYLVTKTTGATYHQRLHALSLTDGSEKGRSPIEIDSSITASGNCEGSTSIPFDPLVENQRAALALVNGVVYASWGSLMIRIGVLIDALRRVRAETRARSLLDGSLPNLPAADDYDRLAAVGETVGGIHRSRCVRAASPKTPLLY